MFRLVTDPVLVIDSSPPSSCFYVPLLNELARKDVTTARLMKKICGAEVSSAQIYFNLVCFQTRLGNRKNMFGKEKSILKSLGKREEKTFYTTNKCCPIIIYVYYNKELA